MFFFKIQTRCVLKIGFLPQIIANSIGRLGGPATVILDGAIAKPVGNPDPLGNERQFRPREA